MTLAAARSQPSEAPVLRCDPESPPPRRSSRRERLRARSREGDIRG
jgi:hypothetical protein